MSNVNAIQLYFSCLCVFSSFFCMLWRDKNFITSENQILRFRFLHGDKTRPISLKDFKKTPLVVKSVLEPNCKRCSKKAIREKFVLKPLPETKRNSFRVTMQLKPKTQGRKREVYPISLSYIWTTIENQLQNVYDSQKIQFFSSLHRPRTIFRHQKGHQRANGLFRSIVIIEKTNTAVIGVEHQKPVNVEKKIDNGVFGFAK